MSKAATPAPPDEPTRPIHPEFERQLRTLLRSGQPLTTVNGCQEMFRAQEAIEAVAASMPKPYSTFLWTPSRGFTRPGGDERAVPFVDKAEAEAYRQPLEALRLIPHIKANVAECTMAVFIFQNLHTYLDSPTVRDALQFLVDSGQLVSTEKGNAYRRLIVLLHPAEALHHEMRGYASPLAFPPAGAADMLDAIDYIGRSIMGGKAACPAELCTRMAATMLGLTRKQAEDVVAQGLAGVGRWNEEMLAVVEQTKAAQIRQDGFLTYIPPEMSADPDDVAGWDNVKRYIRRQAQAYTPAGRAMRLPRPAGLALVGPTGTAKSTLAKAARGEIYRATGLMLPVFKINYDALFAGLVGETEANVRRVIATLRAQRMYILVFDEFEKFVGTGGGEGDGGTARRAAAKLLDWLSERMLEEGDEADQGYVLATMNSFNGVAPEFLRRFDQVFFADLPDAAVRRQILGIQLKLNHVDPATVVGAAGRPLAEADWAALAEATADFSGAEIRKAVVLGRLLATEARPDDPAGRPTFEELHRAIADTGRSIVARSQAEAIAALREYFRPRAMPIQDPTPVASEPRPARAGRAIDTSSN